MIDVEDLIALVRNYNPRCNADLIRKAYAYGLKMHEGQMRKSGEPYFTHPVAVAAILTEQRLDDATIVTALLHDTIEDTRSTYAEISGTNAWFKKVHDAMMAFRADAYLWAQFSEYTFDRFMMKQQQEKNL